MSTMLTFLDRFFEKNPILLAAFIGVHPDVLCEQADGDAQDGGQWR